MSSPEIQARLEELESRLAFQDDLIESLNEVIARQVSTDIGRRPEQGHEALGDSGGSKLLGLALTGQIDRLAPYPRFEELLDRSLNNILWILRHDIASKF